MNLTFIQAPKESGSLDAEGKIVYRKWEGSSSHVLIYLHGVQSHSEWLIESGKALSKRGLTVYAPDRRGSGLSGFPKGEIESYQTYLDDLRLFVDFVRTQEPNKKIHFLGLCWGARLCVPLCLEEERGIESLILLSPGLIPRVDYSIFEKIKIAFAYLTRSKQKFPLPLKDSFFTNTPSYLKFIQNDSLGLRHVPASFLVETLKLNRLACRCLSAVKQPILLLLAGKDQIVDTEKTSAFFKKQSQLKTDIEIFPDWHHTLEFEEEASKLYDTIFNWIEEKRG